MVLRMDIEKYLSIIHGATFEHDGDWLEQKNGHFLKRYFLNCETFWKTVVVPSTRRVEASVSPNERIKPREIVAEDIKALGATHYSMCSHLVFAHLHLEHIEDDACPCSFEDFYSHLGSVCDLSETVLLNFYLLKLECGALKSRVFEELEEHEFLDIARDWYKQRYADAYEHYCSKGKFLSIALPSKGILLDEYFDGSAHHKTYKEFKQQVNLLRVYRNVIVHHARIAKVHDGSGTLVPKKEEVYRYKKWSQVVAALKDKKRFEDFVPMKEQMKSDIEDLEKILNKLWEKPLGEIRQLLVMERNKILLDKYKLDLSGPSPKASDLSSEAIVAASQMTSSGIVTIPNEGSKPFGASAPTVSEGAPLSEPSELEKSQEYEWIENKRAFASDFFEVPANEKLANGRKRRSGKKTGKE